MKDIEVLISGLSLEARPVRGMRSPAGLFAVWMAGAGVYLALVLLVYLQPRPDLMEMLRQPLFLAEIAALGAVAVTTALSATLFSFPDSYQKRWPHYLPMISVGLFVLVLALEYMADNPPAPQPAHQMECCAAITFAALPLAAWMFVRMRRMAPVQAGLAGCTALVSSFSIGALALRLSEPTNSIHHLIMMHYLPMIAMGLIGVGVGKKILKW